MTLDIGNATIQASTRARDALAAAAPRAGERSMAAFAKGAIFSEALLAAVKARVNEFKLVAK